jgi:serine/threonine-protein kinase HipA
VTNLLRRTTVNVAVGNADAHAKNFSILHDADSPAIRLAPLYDVADIRKVTTASLVDEAAAWGIRRRAAVSVITETLDRVLAAIGEIPGDERILAIIRTQAEQVSRNQR